MCAGVFLQRDPPMFSGTDEMDVEDWLVEFERVSGPNKWDESGKLTHVSFYLTDVAKLWYFNHEADFTNWSAFKEKLTSFFGRPGVRKLRAEHRLRARAQKNGETFTSYIEDVIDLCKRVNVSMAESDKIRHILKGIDDDAFHMLVAKCPQTVTQVIELCQSFDELRKERLSTRRAGIPTAELSALEARSTGAEYSALLPQIKQYVREEVARQLSLVACVNESPTALDHSLRRVIQSQVAEALPPPVPTTQVAAPLTYAEAVTHSYARPTPVPSGSVTNFYSSPRPVRPVRPVHAPPFSPPGPSHNPWRTPDNRPICYACGIPGHVARHCRRRGLHSHDDATNLGYMPQQPARRTPADSSDTYSHRATFASRRSPSPRRRSISPMLRRSNSAQEEN